MSRPAAAAAAAAATVADAPAIENAMPLPVRWVLALLRVDEFVELREMPRP